MLTVAHEPTSSGSHQAGPAGQGEVSGPAARGQPSPLTLPLSRITNGQEFLAGGKAANLSALLRAGLPVPQGFCVTVAAFQEFLQSSARNPEAARRLSRVSDCRPDELSELSHELVHSLAAAPMPGAVEEAVLAAWRSMGEHKAYAVRSSATVEDGAARSFAGQFESVLNVRGPTALLAAVKQCWLSLFSARALAYHVRQQLPVTKTSVAVLVQEMVPAEIAGVLFTLDPVTGDAERIFIEAARGVGDRLVSGHAVPESVVLAKARFRVLERRPPSARPLLDKALLRQLRALACDAERLFERPLDIEWACVKHRVFLLQARPATAVPKPRSWADRQRWSNVNTGEVFPDVATPMTWSAVQALFQPLFGSLFRMAGVDLRRACIAGLVAGRIYFNANTGLAAIKSFRFVVGNLSDVARAVGGGETEEYARGLTEIPDSDLPDLGFSWPKYILSWPRILYDVITHLPHRADAWMFRFKARVEELRRLDIPSMSTRKLAESILYVARGSVADWDLLYLIMGGVTLPLLHKACRDWLDDPHFTLGFRLFGGVGGVPEAEAGMALWRLAVLADANAETRTLLLSGENWEQFQTRLEQTDHGRRFLRAWNEFMSEHGHHCRGQLELFNARWAETPGYVLGVVRGYLRGLGQTDPVEKHRQLAEERRKLTQQCRSRLTPLKRWLFSLSLAQGQKTAVSREVWKDQAVRQFFVLRRMLLELGRRLHRQGVFSAPDDIFFLELDEIEPAATGVPERNIRELICSRRDEYNYNLTLSPPPGVIGKFDPGAPTTLKPPPDPSAKQLKGIPVSPGIVTGPARVILRAEVCEQVLPGEILVAPFTDPAWTPYFIPAAGVVIEQGGVLSHGSIVARELGLPAVTNTAGATQLIRTGDLLELDANHGRVTILGRERH